MSGNPDVLEYYRSKHSSKPIRVIDLSECAVWKHVGPGFVRKEFQNNFVFIVKTTSRTFYLVAKTEVEMLVWVYSISQVCNLGQLEDGAGESRAWVPVRHGVAVGTGYQNFSRKVQFYRWLPFTWFEISGPNVPHTAHK